MERDKRDFDPRYCAFVECAVRNGGLAPEGPLEYYVERWPVMVRDNEAARVNFFFPLSKPLVASYSYLSYTTLHLTLSSPRKNSSGCA